MPVENKQSIIVLSLIIAICLAGDSMLYVVLPTHWREVGLTSLTQVGVLLSINRFVRLPLNPLIGFIYKKIPFRSGFLVAIIFSGVTTIGYGFVKDFEIWLMLRTVWGFSWSLFKLGAYLLILQLATDTNRGSYMGIFNGLYRLGSLIGMLLGGILTDLFGITVISLFLGLSVFMSIPILFNYIPKTLEREEKSETSITFLTRLLTLTDKNFILILMTAFLLIMLLDGMLTASLSHIIQVKYTNQISLFGLFLGATTLAGVLQAIRWGIAPFVVSKVGISLDKTKEKNKILAGFLFSAVILLSVIPLDLPLVIWLPIMLIHLLVSSSLLMIIDTLFSNSTSKVSNKIFVMTTFTVIVDLGAALGPIAGYTLEEAIGLKNVFWLAASICLILTILWMLPTNRKVMIVK